MELLIEIIGEVVIEGLFELGTNKKIPKWIRIPIIVLFILFYLAITVGLAYLGIITFQENNIGGIVLILLSLLCMIIFVFGIRKIVKDN